MDMPTYDIAISGAGPAGSALALALARKSPRPERIALIGRRFAASRGPAAEKAGMAIDPRTLALNHGSRILLEQLAAWPAASADIRTVHVSQAGRLGRSLIRYDELGVPRLGSVVGYDDLLYSLHAALLDSGVSLIEATPTQTLAAGQVEFDLGSSRLRSALAVQSDGIRPQGIERRYRQSAVLATVRALRPRQAWAFERFTRNGPLAILPHPHGDDLYGVVWCCPPAEAERIRSLDDTDFARALYAMFGSRLGHFQPLGERHVFPLSMHAGPSLINARCVAVGNAAQTLHPVAGQGLNLGLRDVAQLAQALSPWLARPESDPAGLLAQFARQRRPDRWLTAGITDFLPRVFATGNPLVEHAGGLALLALDILPPLRDPLARHLLQGLRT
ncbi:FAD-dependent monooxygenase [Pollutimonas sp. M17]|uniref:FAD-dependent monooxygenase n=1 Tax=Pollutimonas sp. M17 TaxID=2962065 RepID=UPI0021F46187|nr:FAD-dependent monooxygenase [Pollutimonas sp. M17]UYO92872.1 FAD-dependent monooxygenase [Pollutimonas sp. M17]